MNTLTTAWRNIHRNRRRSLLSLLAVLLVSTILVVGFSVLEGMKADLVWNTQSFTTGTVRIVNPLYEKNKSLSPLHLNIPRAGEVVQWAQARPETLTATARVIFGCSITQGDRLYLAQGWGADLEREESFCRLSSWLTEGRLPASGEGVRETAMGWELARTLGLKVGDKFTFLSSTVSGTNMVTLKITGLLNFPVGPMNLRYFLVPLERAQYYLRMGEAALEVVAKTKEGLDPAQVAAAWTQEVKNRGLEAESWDRASLVYTMVRVVEVIYNLIALLFILLGSTVVVNTTMMVVFERRKEIGTLSALGMPAGQLVGLFLVEAMILGMTGTTLGVALGAGLTAVLHTQGLDLTGLMGGIDIEFPSILRPVLNLRSLAGTWIMITVISSLAALVPSTMAARTQPIEALRD